MKILVLSNYYPPYFVGGYELACAQSVNYLKSKGHDVLVLTSNYQSAESNETSVKRGFQILNMAAPSFKDTFNVEWQNHKWTRTQIDRFQPDVIYVWNLRMVSLGPLFAAQKSQIPMVFEFGDFWLDSYAPKSYKAKLKQRIKCLLPVFPHVPLRLNTAISVSQWMVGELQKKYQPQKVWVVPNGTEMKPKRAFKAKSSEFKLLFLGRLDPEKGLHLLIKALGKLSLPHVTLSVVGEGNPEYLKVCQDLVQQYRLNHQVTFFGKTSRPEDFYKNHDLFVMPTLMREPFGMVIIEAMMNGIPVLTSNKYGPGEIVTHLHNGLLFEFGNIGSLTSELRNAVSQPTLIKELAKQAYHDAKTEYSLPFVKSQVEAILKGACA